MEGSYWFRRIVKEARKISPHIRFKRIKHGFYRIYYKTAYIGECFKNMPEMGHDILEKNYHFSENQDNYQRYHDPADNTMRLKNFVEGYHEVKDRLLTRVYMFRHDKEFYEKARKGYSEMRIK